MGRGYPWKTFAVLAGAATLTSPLAVPYVSGLQAIAPHPQPIAALSPGSLALLLLGRSLVFIVPAAALGLLVAGRIGLGAPHLEHRLDGAPRPAAPLASIVWPACLWAAVTAVIALAVDAFFLRVLGVDFPAPEIHARIAVDWWRGGLASLWAPFGEEILDRLFLLSLLAWLGTKLFRAREGRGRTLALWGANLATALFFGWYHIDNQRLFAEVVPPLVALRTMLILLPVGLAFGWLYFRRGLEAAILSHFVIDLLVHVVRPLVERGAG